jgi:GDPmannose 4,6-dehydratase
MKIACVTGACGQIGSYLCEILLQEGYEIFGLKHANNSVPKYMDSLLSNPKMHLITGDVTNIGMITKYVSTYQPYLFINCAAQSNVVSSFNLSEYTIRNTGDSVKNCLEAIRQCSPTTRFVTLGSSLMFGDTPPPQNETSCLDPKSPYAKAKVMGYNSTIQYREKYGLFACNTICFNSESPRRSEEYVSRKITKATTLIKQGLQDKLILGNLQALRDFSHAQDTAWAIFKIITHSEPDDFVVASGQQHSIQELVESAFTHCQLCWQDYVETDPKYFRSEKENIYCGDISKINNKLGWSPCYSFDDLVKEMVDFDLNDG